MNKDFPYRTSIWLTETYPPVPEVIDQRFLPFETRLFRISHMDDAAFAIREMVVRGAPLIGVTAAFGMYLALLDCNNENPEDCLRKAEEVLNDTRPTAVNLFAATSRMLNAFLHAPVNKDRKEILFNEACRIREEEIEACHQIGLYGLPLIEEISHRKNGQQVQILTHCNAGWLACVEWGTATAPLYMAHRKGIPIHVWVDETRPRNQGARLTAFELGLEGIPHTVIPDNAGGHLMQHGKVDMVIVGSDRTSRNGDVANKIGTYLKALAAADNNIPFYVALPVSSFDPDTDDGIRNIRVEERDAAEVYSIEGWNGSEIVSVRLIPEGSRAANYGFDVTPAGLVTALITDRGICRANTESISKLLFPE
jgi:methylthioribose-1-phosphate isomerase